MITYTIFKASFNAHTLDLGVILSQAMMQKHWVNWTPALKTIVHEEKLYINYKKYIYFYFVALQKKKIKAK